MNLLTATCLRCDALVPTNVTAAEASGLTCVCCGRFCKGTSGDGCCPECTAAAQAAPQRHPHSAEIVETGLDFISRPLTGR